VAGGRCAAKFVGRALARCGWVWTRVFSIMVVLPSCGFRRLTFASGMSDYTWEEPEWSPAPPASGGGRPVGATCVAQPGMTGGL
jgi:hypothetical protein